MRVNGAVYRIKFVPRERPYNTGLLAVGNPILADAIRKHPYFGTVITEVQEEQEPEQEAQKTYEASYPGVTSAQQAADILVTNHGADPTKVKGKAAVKEMAEKLNIEFPNLK